MRPISIFYVFLFLCCSNHVLSQSDERSYDSMSFFYVDNSGDSKLKALNAEAKKYLNELLKEKQSLKKNFLYLYGVNGGTPLQIDTAHLISKSAAVAKYLSKPSDTSDYEGDRQQILNYFSKNIIKVNVQLNVYLFLSSKAIINMITGMEKMPTPVIFPGELGHYIHSDGPIYTTIFLVTNKEIRKKYTDVQIARCFIFSDSGESDNYRRPVVVFK